MIGQPFRLYWRTEDTSEALKAAYLAARDDGLRTRFHGLWLLRTGRKLGDVASGGSLSNGTDLGGLVWTRRSGCG